MGDTGLRGTSAWTLATAGDDPLSSGEGGIPGGGFGVAPNEGDPLGLMGGVPGGGGGTSLP